MNKAPRWSIYIVRCGAGTLYTGITTDIRRRLAEHRGKDGWGAKYLRGRGPLRLVYTKTAGTRSRALKMEYRVKKMDRREKEDLISGKGRFIFRGLRPGRRVPPTR
ncbi:MAG: GIY-YIG nuclease family protein [Chitinispirillaceae bacterium]|nr:GIY-YIG nuclease family protein [Chitinispirillaceae bacterium]